jgi:hypothetical protein
MVHSHILPSAHYLCQPSFAEYPHCFGRPLLLTRKYTREARGRSQLLSSCITLACPQP